LSDHYAIHLFKHTADSFEFFFETKRAIKYFVRFTRATYLFQETCIPCSNIFEISFSPETHSSGKDPRTRNTIIKLIANFIAENRTPVLYVCDNLDNREFPRLKLFKQWFKETKSDEFQHDYRILEFEDYRVILGIIAYKWDTAFDGYFEYLENY
jgi:hypothetical protein